MTKDRLRSLSYTELSRIAELGHIAVLQDMDKESLVSVVFEALEEERIDREGNNNLTIQIEAKKYSVSQDEELFLEFGSEIVLPDRYRENVLVLMLRDPSWVYCYWDIEDRTLAELEVNDDFSGLILRVTELISPDWSKDSVVDWFDIPIQFDDLRRYINLPSEDTYYGVEIYAQLGEKEAVIVRSNIVASSRDYVAPAPGDDNPNREKLIELSGFSTDIGKFPGANVELYNPQRIIGSGDNREND